MLAVVHAVLMAFYLSTHTVNVSMLGNSIIADMNGDKASMAPPFNAHQNLGVSGNTVAQIAARVGNISASATHVVLEGGTNDLVGLGTDAGIIPNYTTILNAISPSVKVIVLGIPQVDEAALEAAHPGWTTYINNTNVHAMNVRISNLCRTYANCVPATGLMARKMVGRTSDGIHPVSSERIEMVRRLLPYLGL